MAGRLAFDVIPAVRYAEVLATAPEVARAEIGLALDESAFLLQREVKEATPKGVGGTLQQSITFDRRDTDEAQQAAVFSPLNYAAPVELGTKPHWAPLAPLEDWVRAKLTLEPGDTVEEVARSVQRKIGYRGTRPANMFRGAVTRTRQQITQIGTAAVSRIYQRLSGGV